MGSVNVEPESDSEYEEWMPSVIKRWNTFERGDKNEKKYTVFLRFVFKAYMIPARVNIRRIGPHGYVMNKKRIPRNKSQTLQNQYDGRARTMDAIRDNIKEIWKIIWAFPVQYFATGLEYPYEYSLLQREVKYDDPQIWGLNRCNGRAYARMAMCVGKSDMSYLPADLREKILS